MCTGVRSPYLKFHKFSVEHPVVISANYTDRELPLITAMILKVFIVEVIVCQWRCSVLVWFSIKIIWTLNRTSFVYMNNGKIGSRNHNFGKLFIPCRLIKFFVNSTNYMNLCDTQYYRIKREQLDVSCFIISLFNAQHVSDVNTSILRSLRLIWWVVSWVVLLWFDVCWCYVVVWLGWCGIRMQAEALVVHCGLAGVVWYPYAGWSTSTYSLFNAQHVSDVNTSILRSLQLICWVVSWVVLFWYDVCWCYVVVWLGWCGIRMQASALLQLVSEYHSLQPGCINIRNMLSIK